MRVPSTFIAWSNENKSCMRVDKREFTWEFHQLSLLDETRTRVAWELTTSESLHERFINIHCLIKRKQELHESWQARVYWHERLQARVYMKDSSTFLAWSNENKSCMIVDYKREYTWKIHQFSLPDPQMRTRVGKWEKELHESWQERVHMIVYIWFQYLICCQIYW